MPSCIASCLVTSVLPTPVGPANRKLPIGLSGLARPERASLIADGQRLDRRILAEDRPSSGCARGCCSTSLSDALTCLVGMRAILATIVLDLLDVDHGLAVGVRQQPLARAGLVDHVDGLVRQQAVADVLDRQVDRGLQRVGGVLDLVVLLVSGLEALAGSRRSRATVGSTTSIFWKRRASARSFSKIAAVFLERGRADAAQLAATPAPA